ncbi:MAG: UbiA family prenyltransferase [Ornithinimicrobium sp.]|uniref:UbiA family prenyltransferase n=1 Tax=Ornithinimicrobium sp. TaxID=1977084 RepID=UPI0017B5818A|nr:UbiA family prenyltransferase [Actinomycetota bacterium]
MPQVVTRRAVIGGLAQTCHPGPTVAVTALTALLALGSRPGSTASVPADPTGVLWSGPSLVLLVSAAVLAGQLSIGWSNDLVDARRDREAHRQDKPLARGQLPVRAVRVAIVGALVASVLLSAALGWRAALVHLVLVVGSGWAYNLGLKPTVWSWVPYAVAFGSLPAVVWLAGPQPVWPPVWMTVVGALLGVGAHLLNVLPDLVEDERAGVRGLPHRLGERRVRVLGPLLLLCGSVVVTLAPAGPVPWWAWAVLTLCLALAVVAWSTRGRTPFAAAIGIALLDVAGLVLR